MKRRLHKTVFAGIVTLIISFAVLVVYACEIRREAAALLGDVASLRPGQATLADVKAIVDAHKRHLVKRDCVLETCDFELQITNRGLSMLRLEPPTRFAVGISTDHGRVVRVGAALSRSMPIYPTFFASAGMVEAYAEIPARYQEAGHYLFPTPVGKPYLFVRIDNSATQSQRQHAFAFSFECFTKPGSGCDLPCDYLPLAWRDWKADLRTTGFPMSDFDQAYPHNERCH